MQNYIDMVVFRLASIRARYELSVSVRVRRAEEFAGQAGANKARAKQATRHGASTCSAEFKQQTFVTQYHEYTMIKYYNTHFLAVSTRLAQLEERSAFNRVVVGSIPTSGAFCVFAKKRMHVINLLLKLKCRNNLIMAFSLIC